MAYLDNTTITVDAVLTKKGRERLSQGRSAFNITKFAVADDEVDYSLYNTAHPLGSNYYSDIIENMPVIEAIPDETQVLRYKLVTLDRGSTGVARLPIISLGSVGDSVSLRPSDSPLDLRPTTTIFTTSGVADQQLDTQMGYTLILYDEEAADVVITQQLPASAQYVTPPTGNNVNFSSAVVAAGFQFQIVPRVVTSTKNTKITVYGNESGATKTFNLTVQPPLTI